jgi:hypothetical protein
MVFNSNGASPIFAKVEEPELFKTGGKWKKKGKRERSSSG